MFNINLNFKILDQKSDIQKFAKYSVTVKQIVTPKKFNSLSVYCYFLKKINYGLFIAIIIYAWLILISSYIFNHIYLTKSSVNCLYINYIDANIRGWCWKGFSFT